MSTMASSAIIEGFFNRYGFARSKVRSAMLDGTAAGILLTHELEDIVGDVHEAFTNVFKLRDVALTDRLVGWA